jgi:hypothetical protein
MSTEFLNAYYLRLLCAPITGPTKISAKSFPQRDGRIRDAQVHARHD